MDTTELLALVLLLTIVIECEKMPNPVVAYYTVTGNLIDF